jgi:acyl-[acyl-carrier-protein]-phospholipid O-acyltransferase/long-chain-fatty-acid--[acyl-carrier-protein] ligase
MADTTGTELSFGKTLIGSMLLSRWLRQHRSNDSMVGILLPASAGGALANIAVSLTGKIPVNLNFTSGQEAMNAAIRQCESTLITSRRFCQGNISEMPGMVSWRDQGNLHLGHKLLAAHGFCVPSRLLERHYTKNQSQDLAIISRAAAREPQSVMLSITTYSPTSKAFASDPFHPKRQVMGVLPFFHSFGFSISLWLPLVVGFGAVYHPNPMDAKTIGETVQKYKATILISTPTFYVGYMRRCTVEEFATLRYAIAGAEKLREQIRKAFKEKCLDLLEGYGCRAGTGCLHKPSRRGRRPRTTDGSETGTWVTRFRAWHQGCRC